MLVNLYFLVIISIKADFRNVDTYPVALQGFLALVFVSFALTSEAIVRFWYFETIETGETNYESHIFSCACTFGYSHMNEISTPIIMLALAIQRFFKVCKPFISNQPEFLKYQLRGNVILTVLPFLVLTIHVVAVVYRYDGSWNMQQLCYAGFFWDTTYRATIGGAIFFYVPVMVCAVLYVFVGKSLMAMTTMEDRNRQLTTIFMTSCVLWFLFWLPERIMYLYYENMSSTFLLGKSKLFHFFLNRNDFFTHFFSLLQPIVIVLSYRPLHEPIVNLYNKVLETCRKVFAKNETQNQPGEST